MAIVRIGRPVPYVLLTKQEYTGNVRDGQAPIQHRDSFLAFLTLVGYINANHVKIFF